MKTKKLIKMENKNKNIGKIINFHSIGVKDAIGSDSAVKWYNKNWAPTAEKIFANIIN